MTKKIIIALLATALLPPPLLAQEGDPFSDMLNNRNYDRDALIRQFENLHVTVSPPPQTRQELPETEEQTPTTPSSSEQRGLFRPIQPELPPDAQQMHSLRMLALLLPLKGRGNTYAAADAFHLGCVDVLRADSTSLPGQPPLQLDTYAHDGSNAQALKAYEQAIADGADFVIGPMLKNTVRTLRQAYARAPVRTLLLQPGAAGTGYYVLTLDIGEEVAELARHIAEQAQHVLVIADGTELSQRQRLAFAEAWHSATGNDAALDYVYIYDARKDWQKLFEQLKNKTERAEEAKAQGKTPSPTPVLFAAGDGDFIRRARNFSPQGYILYASSVFFSHTEDERFLDNLRILEMPWFVATESDARHHFARLQMRTRPALQQRFYALGADACRAVRESFLWSEGWQMQGVSGELVLSTDSTLRRRGIPSQYVAGTLKPLQ